MASTHGQPASNRKFFIGGNWKLNGTRESLPKLCKVFNEAGPFPETAEVVIAPTAVHVDFALRTLRKDIAISAQNISTDKGFGAYTGELTAEVFKDWGCQWTLAGHSERRRRKSTRNLGATWHRPRGRPGSRCACYLLPAAWP